MNFLSMANINSSPHVPACKYYLIHYNRNKTTVVIGGSNPSFYFQENTNVTLKFVHGYEVIPGVSDDKSREKFLSYISVHRCYHI